MGKVIFLGATGRVGRMVGAAWPAGGPPLDPRARGQWEEGQAGPDECVLCLAGVTPRSGAPLEDNTRIALAALRMARRRGARHLFVASSSAVLGDTGTKAASESFGARPAGAYGREKLSMEEALLADAATDGTSVTVLRIGNVAGAGEPFDTIGAGGAPRLDRFADGAGPSRSYIGPVSLARVLSRLCQMALEGARLPDRLNVAAPGATAMADIFAALGQPPEWRPAPSGAIQRVHMDCSALMALCPLPRDAHHADRLLDEIRAAT
ncbi:UDP-glucose 4-epimerase [Profundibacterium mesophilum KAUST100406-0324]|uniref:UDP-glucose 4-epimerase n=2 Tax=Profundibacterium TaxID=1258570 RepID=A0A921NS79_9RHOB|nr:UDP-glucose 4-epimerase [Profundibacterium mesophilum KAUST100406-0324]